MSKYLNLTAKIESCLDAHLVGLSFFNVISDSFVSEERMFHLLILWPKKTYND